MNIKSVENENIPIKQELLLSAVVVLCTHFKSISTAIVLCSILKPTVVLRTMYVCWSPNPSLGRSRTFKKYT